MLRERQEVAILLEKYVVAFQTVSRDDEINRLANGYALAAQRSEMRSRAACQLVVEQCDDRIAAQGAFKETGVDVAPCTLQDFKQDKIAYQYVAVQRGDAECFHRS